jgi:glycosyltransferase involved in cell wall biosynthesis
MSLPLHIFFLVDLIDESCGGAERFAAALATELKKSGFTVTVCATRHLDDEFRTQLDSAGVRTLALGRKSKWDIHRLFKLRRILRASDAQVLHTHKFGSNAWGTLFGRMAGVPLIIAHEHTWSYQGQPVRRLIDGQFIGRFADLFVAVSDQDAERMISYEKVPAKKVRVLPTAGATTSATPRHWNVREMLDLPANAKVISVAAMMRPQKALDVLIEAMTTVVKSRPDAHLVLVGDGPCRAEWESLAADLKLADHIHFLGIRADIAGLLAESDCAALSSDYEGMPLFVLESLSAGTPMIATDVGAVGRLVRDNETGRLVPVRNPLRMADAILQLLDDPIARKRMSAACREMAEPYTMVAVSKQFADLYTDLARDRGIMP